MEMDNVLLLYWLETQKCIQVYVFFLKIKQIEYTVCQWAEVQKIKIILLYYHYIMQLFVVL